MTLLRSVNNFDCHLLYPAARFFALARLKSGGSRLISWVLPRSELVRAFAVLMYRQVSTAHFAYETFLFGCILRSYGPHARSNATIATYCSQVFYTNASVTLGSGSTYGLSLLSGLNLAFSFYCCLRFLTHSNHVYTETRTIDVKMEGIVKAECVLIEDCEA